jgi:hypothetical protein
VCGKPEFYTAFKWRLGSPWAIRLCVTSRTPIPASMRATEFGSGVVTAGATVNVTCSDRITELKPEVNSVVKIGWGVPGPAVEKKFHTLPVAVWNVSPSVSNGDVPAGSGNSRSSVKGLPGGIREVIEDPAKVPVTPVIR